MLSNYKGSQKMNIIVVFDAYLVKGNVGSVFQYHNISVVYTKEAETADHFIERTVNRLPRHYKVSVATSDGLEQIIILGEGAQKNLQHRDCVKEFWQNKKKYVKIHRK